MNDLMVALALLAWSVANVICTFVVIRQRKELTKAEEMFRVWRRFYSADRPIHERK